jgi:hypothetical protein
MGMLRGWRIWIRAEARKICDPQVIARTGRHKAKRLILTENAEAIIESWYGYQRNSDRKLSNVSFF